METLGTRLKEARKARGWSQGRLATAAGVSQGTIGNVEAGIRDAPRELLTIAKVLGVRPEWLKTGEEPRQAGEEAAIDRPGPPDILGNLVNLDLRLADMAEELQAAGRATLGKWAAGKLSATEAAQTLEALIKASEKLED
ncbi:helix-turn-helix transcriptional regulator [Curvibacter sp. HBC61]|uniref:Helix-turn-helix transcriptional regulator n=1 Tax=Curvibacter cyanobacteriorum TaxID=3026422 RepID=A0ABT5MWQ0_9BURK|nr:helix-turn-helix transcriptional regulator [Curvibacter sp. HBC61]MDD0837881.1 helix-turn-helix transcriptional regulator [Curvibacter sp. HBC61]